MENRKKFYSNGLWGKDTLQDRYWHVMDALEAYRHHLLDEQDLVFVIKNAFVSKIYISQGVAIAYPAQQTAFANLEELYGKLLTDHVLNLQDSLPQLNTKYMEICELGSKVSDLKRAKPPKIAKAKPSILVEHVVPANVYMKDVKGITSFQDFKAIFDAVSICLITNAEVKRLDKNHLRTSMPPGADYKKNSFARYNTAGVIVYSNKNLKQIVKHK